MAPKTIAVTADAGFEQRIDQRLGEGTAISSGQYFPLIGNLHFWGAAGSLSDL